MDARKIINPLNGGFFTSAIYTYNLVVVTFLHFSTTFACKLQYMVVIFTHRQQAASAAEILNNLAQALRALTGLRDTSPVSTLAPIPVPPGKNLHVAESMMLKPTVSK